MKPIPQNILDKVGKNLHNKPNHPLEIIKREIYQYFGESFTKIEDISPIVSTEQNFDSLLIPTEHVSRRESDTYYYNRDTLLRSHTSAHQADLIKQGITKFLVTGDVYRRDEIDTYHYPVFHQMEGVKLIDNAVEDLKTTLNGLVAHLFPGLQIRILDSYFPFTEPSFEFEIYHNEKWVEVLGCGKINQKILDNCGLSDKQGWAFGLGLERLAMILFQIPDIRLFWSEDQRFLSQFSEGKIVMFKPYSKYPLCYKDISFWLNEQFNLNYFYDMAREMGGDMIENISTIDRFTHPKTGKESVCLRIVYRHNDRTLTNAEIDDIQAKIRMTTVEQFGVELR